MEKGKQACLMAQEIGVDCPQRIVPSSMNKHKNKEFTRLKKGFISNEKTHRRWNAILKSHETSSLKQYFFWVFRYRNIFAFISQYSRCPFPMNGLFGQPNINQMDSGGGNPGFSAECTSYMNDLEIIKCGGNSESFQSANNDLQRIITSPSFPSIFMQINFYLYLTQRIIQ